MQSRITTVGIWFMLIGACALVGADKPRDLSQYEVAGPYLIQYPGAPAEADRLSGQLREFLWTHWRQRRRGTVVATLRFIEGTVKTSYFVEPDKQGRWVIVEYTDYPYAPRIPVEAFSCAEFERVEPDRLHLPLVPIPDLEPREPEMYLLHPICSKGKNAKLW